MPLYEYMCESCGREEEVLQKHADPAPVCEPCQYEMKRLVSVSSFSLEGPGWAKDNYGLKDNQ